MRILPEKAAAVLVDVQEKLFPHMHERETLNRNLPILLKGLELLGVPMLVTQQYTRGLGPTTAALREVLGWSTVPAADADPGADRYIEKIAFSCWDEPAFRRAFEALGRDCVLLAGIESHVCMLQTAVDLQEAGFTPVVIEDCTSSRRENDKRVAMQRLHAEGIRVSTYESILFELAREAGTDTFRAISRLVK